MCAFFLSSCSARTTTVILLAEEDGSVGMVRVEGLRGSEIIDQENSYTVVDFLGPSRVKDISSADISERFSSVMKAEALKPVSFLLYFDTDSTTLVAKSKPVMAKLYKKLKEQQPAYVSVIGHTDRAGVRDYNIELSLKRAVSIEKMIKAFGLLIAKIEIASHGENDPLIKTPNGVPKRKNRRVEVIVR